MATARKTSALRACTWSYAATATIGGATRAATTGGTHHASRPPVRRAIRSASATAGSTKTTDRRNAITPMSVPNERSPAARAEISTGVSGGGCVRTYRKTTTTASATSRQPTSAETTSTRPYDRF
ncbi:hypothetical protein ACFZBM_31630 [Streptomyces lavendulae]|uniref:hypothetical protein n=1 Tax=Streptomyces lavendulae TaxID=1914 RepID=UPI000C295704|nr:hypothetical protein [Streptomyces lavendulae]